MPALSFAEYAKEITDTIEALLSSGQARLVHLQVDQRSLRAGYLAGILAFEDDAELHFREFIDLSREEPRVMYAYHYQNAQKILVFRYDNAAHHGFQNQAMHKHISDDVQAFQAPAFSKVVEEILRQF